MVYVKLLPGSRRFVVLVTFWIASPEISTFVVVPPVQLPLVPPTVALLWM